MRKVQHWLQGILIALGSRKKKERTKKIRILMDELGKAEQEHKKHPAHHQELYQKVINKRTELKDLLDYETKMALNFTARDRYKWGNKPSKHLAKMLQKKKANFIEKIQTKDGNMVYSPKGIAEIFRTYYQELYAV